MNRAPKIVVIGSANVDLTTFTDEFPRPGETIFGRTFHLGFGGKGANQAVAARRCGAEVSMIARVGEDLFGQATVDNFSAQGVDASRVLITPGVSSGVAPIFVDSAGQNRILVVKGANDRLSPEDVEAAEAVIAGSDFVIVQLEIPLDTVYFALRFARKHGVRTILNPAPGRALDFTELSNADYVIPNETEAEALTGMEVRTLEDARGCTEFLLGKSVQRVIITLGANGALYGAPGTLEHLAGIPVQAVDTTGAGDAFIGSLACFLAQGLDESGAISRANVYAALSTLSAGTQTSFVSLEQFESEWSKKPNQGNYKDRDAGG
jgi:ribokinase